jgi:selenophosphate synthetase-related protein
MSDRYLENLEYLAAKLKQSLGIIQKQDIQVVSQILNLQIDNKIRVGDDCAAIPDGDGYLLLAAEGMWHIKILVWVGLLELY